MARDHLTGEVTGSVIVGRYAFQVGAPAGMRLTLAPSSERTPVGPVEDALARRPPAVPAQTPAAKPSEFVDDASRVTDVAKQAVQLFGALAKGQELDASSLEVEIHTLLELLDHLDRQGRFNEAIRLAQAACALFALALRWAELVHSLDVALHAAQQTSDSPTEAWAVHELGSLMLGADNVLAAVDFLGRARDERERLGEPRDLCLPA